MFRSVFPLATTLAAGYLALGAVFYMHFEHWNLFESLYFAVQAGLNVGYGDQVPANPDSALFTAVYILIGNGLFGGALALFVESNIRRHDVSASSSSLDDTCELREDGDFTEEDCEERTGFSLLIHDVFSLSRSANLLRKDIVESTGRFSLSTWVFTQLEASEVAAAPLDPRNGQPSKRKAMSRGVALIRRDILRLIQDITSGALGRAVFAYLLLYFWIFLGAVYGHIHEGYTWSYSILFAVSSITTFGLIAPSSENLGRVWNFFYLVTGVPIYLSTLGRLADIFVEQYEVEEKKKWLDERRELRDVISAKTPRCDIHSEKLARGNRLGISWSEYMEYELLRRGLVDMETIGDLREEFDHAALECDDDSDLIAPSLLAQKPAPSSQKNGAAM